MSNIVGRTRSFYKVDSDIARALRQWRLIRRDQCRRKLTICYYITTLQFIVRNKHIKSFLLLIVLPLMYAVILESSKINSWAPDAKIVLICEEIMFNSCSAVLLLH